MPNINDEIKANPLDYADLIDIQGISLMPSSGVGHDKVKIKLVDFGTPSWIQEIDKSLALFRRRKRTKVFYDPESLARGIPAKQKAKKVMREKTAFIILDVSGSMFWLSYKGQSILEICASFIPPIARNFEGELWEVDAGAPTKRILLKELKSSDISGMEIKGGGGTDFDIVLKMLQKKREEIKEDNPKSDFIIIILTDAGVSWNLNLIPDNFLLVTLKPMEAYLPQLDEKRNQKAILIDVDKK